MAKKSSEILDTTKYEDFDDRSILDIIKVAREGVAYGDFLKVFKQMFFGLEEWSTFLNMSSRNLHRYKFENRTFDLPKSERILQIVMLHRKGNDLFGDPEMFRSWLDVENIALGRIPPKDLLDSSIGIGLVMDELTKIEHGVLA